MYEKENISVHGNSITVTSARQLSQSWIIGFYHSKHISRAHLNMLSLLLTALRIYVLGLTQDGVKISYQSAFSSSVSYKRKAKPK